ncbi:MAG: 16S rRNA (guanine(527)-N(7))-methyltransferase RsmG [Leptothrix ochracea]|uniref:16S rRNA (guanine(527)-N(7))-methyltransferase RsmG n=1 Tax=Leptothrix ochracea TaxID=735331 RepID=UPI0034E2F370
MTTADVHAFLPTLRQGAAELGVSLDSAAAERLLAYVALIARWNKVYNLTALRALDQMITHHVIDSLALIPPLRVVLGHKAEEQLSVLDVGSGGGMPGVMVATVCPGWQVTCVDAVAKKSTFIRQVSAELGLKNLSAVHSRVEQMPGSFDIITSRAFASLADFVSLTRHLLRPDGLWVAMKGVEPFDEIAALPPDIEMFHVEHLQVPGVDARRCLVWMRKVK